jgi:hypothetical protein
MPRGGEPHPCFPCDVAGPNFADAAHTDNRLESPWMRRSTRVRRWKSRAIEQRVDLQQLVRMRTPQPRSAQMGGPEQESGVGGYHV